MESLIRLTARGLYCEAGDFYIDPHRAVDRAVVTHAHSDHARRGSRHYFCVRESIGLMKCRLGAGIQITGHEYGERFQLGNARVSLHSAGHILGSAQVRVEVDGEVWVASGDYKRELDPTCAPYEPVECDAFITEATFGTPSYRWPSSRDLGAEILDWWTVNASRGINSILFGYSLGKAQRILGELVGRSIRPILIHDTIRDLTECYRQEGVSLAETLTFSQVPSDSTLRGELILAPPSITRSPDWMARIGEHQTAFASGWMQGRNSGRSGSYDHGFVMSDHADWEGLKRSIRESKAKRIYVQHRNGALVRSLRQDGLEAYPVETLHEDRLPRQLLLF